MAAVPLHLFSRLGLNIKMAAPKDTSYPEDEAHAKSKGPSLLDSSQRRRAEGSADRVTLNDGDIPVTFGLNSLKDGLRDRSR